MRRNKTQKRGRGRSIGLVQVRLVQVLMVGGIGYLIGGWHTAALRSTELSAAEAVALRFPETWHNSASASRAPIAVAMASTPGDAQLALLSPEPMVSPANVPQAKPQATPESIAQATPQAVTQTPLQTAALEQAGVSPVPDASEPVQASPQPAAAPAATAQPASETKMAAPAAHRRTVNRPGYMLNDAQIASIKARLNLTPDQEQMWPAVEAALRNIAYTRAQQARGRAAPASTAQTAAVDPNAVRGLKSAAVPLIMSFNAEQKEEVRNLAHVMGLDQLASQF